MAVTPANPLELLLPLGCCAKTILSLESMAFKDRRSRSVLDGDVGECSAHYVADLGQPVDHGVEGLCRIGV